MRKGTVTTVGCLLDVHDTSVVLTDCLNESGIDIPSASFPVIVKKGINKLGENIVFVFNYSMEPSEYVMTCDARDLLEPSISLASGD